LKSPLESLRLVARLRGRGAAAVEIAPGEPAAGRPPARARKRPAHQSLYM